MRIAYLTQSYAPMISGAALFAQHLAEAMADRGHEVLVVAASDTGRAYLESRGRLSVLRLPSVHNPFRVGQRFVLFPRSMVESALRQFGPDILHTHEPLQLGMLGLRYARRRQIPVTLTIHQLPWLLAGYLPAVFRRCAEGILWMYAGWLAGKFTAVVTPTRTISKVVTRQTGIVTSTISCGLDLQVFRPMRSRQEDARVRRKWNLPPRAPLLLHVGRLDGEKRVDRVIRAAADTVQETGAHLIIVGDGIQKPKLAGLCRALGVADRVHFTGFVSVQAGLAELYRTASLFVTASEIETQGIVLLEAAASGLPIVAVHATCIAEIVRHQVNGYLVESGDLPAMSRAMRSLLMDPGRARAMSRASRELAAVHGFPNTIAAYERLYGGMQSTTAPAAIEDALPASVR